MKKFRLSRRKFLAALCSAPLGVAADAWGVEPGWIRVKTVRLKEAARTRFVHITDLHHKGDRSYLEKVVKLINQAAPDFVCFTGDLIEEAHHAPEALEILGGVRCPIYGIPGNHDHWADLDFDLPRQAFAKTGGAWLINQEAAIPERGVQLFGLSGTHYEFSPKVGAMNILLCHYPSTADEYRVRFDLILAGHSHGGQVRLPGYGAIIVPSGCGAYQMGMYETPAGQLYVNPGLGWFYANLRFFCRPEITVFEA